MYITGSDIQGALAADVVIYLVDDEKSRALTPAGQARIDQKIREAESEVNSYLAQRYTLPLPTVPDVLKAKAVDVAVYRLFLRRGIRPNTADEMVENQYKNAVAWLRDVATGKASLTLTGPTGGSDGLKVGGGSEPSIKSDPRIFSRDKLEDF